MTVLFLSNVHNACEMLGFTYCIKYPTTASSETKPGKTSSQLKKPPLDLSEGSRVLSVTTGAARSMQSGPRLWPGIPLCAAAAARTPPTPPTPLPPTPRRHRRRPAGQSDASRERARVAVSTLCGSKCRISALYSQTHSS